MSHKTARDVLCEIDRTLIAHREGQPSLELEVEAFFNTLGLRSFRDAFHSFCGQYGIPTLWSGEPKVWSLVTALYVAIVQDSPVLIDPERACTKLVSKAVIVGCDGEGDGSPFFEATWQIHFLQQERQPYVVKSYSWPDGRQYVHSGPSSENTEGFVQFNCF